MKELFMHVVKKDSRGLYRNYKEIEYVNGSKMLNIGERMISPGIEPPEGYKFKLWDSVVIELPCHSDYKSNKVNDKKDNIWIRGSVYSTEKNGRINVKCMAINAKDFFILSVPVSNVLLSSNFKAV